MAHFSIVIVAHDELYKIAKDPNFGKELETSVLMYSAGTGDGSVLVGRSTSAVKVISSFSGDGYPKMIISEGWGCYDIDKQKLPKHLVPFAKNTLCALLEDAK